MQKLTDFKDSLNRWLRGPENPSDAGAVDISGRIKYLWLVFVGLIILRNAWISDDSYIIFRTIDNFINGYGLRWDVSERVQAFTCPLWTLVLTVFHFVTREAYYTTIAVQTAVSLTTVYLLITRVAPSSFSAALSILIFVLSKGFIDYATSGLENPLSHLLIVLYYISFSKSFADRTDEKSYRAASIIFGLMVLNRMDLILLFVPAHLAITLRGTKIIKRLLTGALCFAPFVLWSLFSLFYYGFVFPNTAYAKLNTGISSYVLMEQGLYYLRNCLDWDPMTAAVIASALLVGFLNSRRMNASFLLSAGVLLQLIYIVRVGGDHMSGRFLTSAFMISAAMVCAWNVSNLYQRIGLLLTFGIIGIVGANVPLFSAGNQERRPLDVADIADERNFCYQDYGLFSQSRKESMATNYLGIRASRHRKAGVHTLIEGNIGLFAYYSGPKVHIVDLLGLTDPLVARLPFAFGNWRPGHYVRFVPPGYLEQIDGLGTIRDRDLSHYYQILKRIISDDLWSWNRIKAIFEFNFGAYDYLRDRYVLQSVGVLNYDALGFFRRDEPVVWNENEATVLGRSGLGLRIPEDRRDESTRSGAKYSVSLAGGERYEILFLKGKTVLDKTEIDLRDKRSGFLSYYQGVVPKNVRNEPYDLIRLRPLGTFGKFSIGHFRFEVGAETRPIAELASGKAGYIFKDRDLDVQLGGIQNWSSCRISIADDTAFRLEFIREEESVWTTAVFVDGWSKEKEKTVYIPELVSQRGFDTIRIIPVAGKSHTKLEYFGP